MIFVRADGNSRVGLGHLMRCLTIADALREQGEETHFILADSRAQELVICRGYPCTVLETDYSHMEEELPKLEELLSRYQPRFLLLDSYFVTERYLRTLRGKVKRACMDDLFCLREPVELLINYNLYGEELGYRKAFGADTKLLLGSAYVPLRKEFCACSYEVRQQAEQILITTGGGDSYNLAGQILTELLKREEQLSFHVVSGSMNPHLPALQRMAEQYGKIHIHSNVQHMAELMKQCDAAVSAGGSTLYELGAVGVPTVCFSFAENQERLAESFGEKELAVFAGSYLKEGRGLFSLIGSRLAELLADVKLRKALSRRARDLVDGRGAERIAEALLREGNSPDRVAKSRDLGYDLQIADGKDREDCENSG